MSANKIDLSFDNFEQVEQRLQHLLDAGYRQQGNWNLAQTASHLNDWLIYPITGYPKPALPTRMVLGILKITSGRRLLKKTLASGFRSGGATLIETVYEKDALSDSAAVEQYRKSIDRFRCHNGNLKPSPLFGHMTPQDMLQLQLAHAGHHLSFLVPTS